jgi:hypothetical protein
MPRVPWMVRPKRSVPPAGIVTGTSTTRPGGDVHRGLPRHLERVQGARHVPRLQGQPAAGITPHANAPEMRTVRGFHVALWRAGELGYALVSDVDSGELRALAPRFLPAR